MGQHIVDDPELVETKPVDNRGRIYLGTEYAGKDVKLVIEEVNEE
jgi:hypothetical protein